MLLLSLFILVSGCSFLFLGSKDDFPSVFSKTDTVLVVVEDGLYDPLFSELQVYTDDLSVAGLNTVVTVWQSGTFEEFRSFLHITADVKKADSVMLVGSLPVAWYEMNAEGRYEVFPSDLYFMDDESVWWDSDNNGLLDHHTKISVTLPVSRIIGSEQELKGYFHKLHNFRTGEIRLPASGFIFKDDDWFDFQRGSSFGLSRIYRDFEIAESPVITTRDEYAWRLTNDGAEFINQWIHSYPRALYVIENNQYRQISLNDISNWNFKGHFYNLFDCSAARFTEENIGMTYLMKTDYAMAIFGSTKVGGCYQPLVFYDILSRKGTWADAYKQWYNHYGNTSDSWFLGMVILGDPSLEVHSDGPVYRMIDMSLPPEPVQEEIDSLNDKFRDFFDSYTF